MVVVRAARKVIENGIVNTIDGKIVEFQAMGENFGRYVTEDPEEIAVLEKNKRVLSPAQYSEMSTPDYIKVRMLADEKTRQLAHTNSLVETIQSREREIHELKQKVQAMEQEKSQPKPK